MTLLRSLLARRDIWRRIAVERLTEPLHLNVAAAFVAALGTFRAKAAFDLVVRQQHAYGLLKAADLARGAGLRRVTVVELGVGGGTGLLNICDLAGAVSRDSGVAFDIVGFDTGRGMPRPRDFRDHPELYKEGWFPIDAEAVRARLPANARLILGDLEDTIDEFVATMTPAAPLGFATLDVDFYSSSVAALRLLTGPADRYFPYLPVYVDDVLHESHNPWAGELLAIAEFNEREEHRKLHFDRNLPYQRVFKHAEWLAHMFKLQVLDHPTRNDLSRPEDVIVVENPYLAR